MRTTVQKILSSQKNCWLVVCTTKVNVSAVFLYITLNGQIFICQLFIKNNFCLYRQITYIISGYGVHTAVSEVLAAATENGSQITFYVVQDDWL